MTVALASLFTGRRVRGDVAMTGEITLRGSVLPVGGIKEKVLAAHRAGIKRVILPDRNRKDLVDIPESVRKDLDLSFVKRIQEALEQTLESVPVEVPGPGAPETPTAFVQA
jgi:ATP-dependent Lon protease